MAQTNKIRSRKNYKFYLFFLLHSFILVFIFTTGVTDITSISHCWKWTIRLKVKTPKLFLWNISICCLLTYNPNFQKMPLFQQMFKEYLKSGAFTGLKSNVNFVSRLLLFFIFFLTVTAKVRKFCNFFYKQS